MRKTRVLYICPGKFGLGGVQITIMQLARTLSQEEVSMDVVVFTDEEGFYENEFLNYGKIYRIPLKKPQTKVEKALSPYSYLVKIYNGIRKIIRENGPYDAIHAAYLFMSAPCVAAARKEGVPVRISHSHVNRPTDVYPFYVEIYNTIYEKICKRIIARNSTVGLGVTKDSLEYLFENFENKHVIRNPVLDKDKFSIDKYEIEERKYLRLIQVGNFSERKNPLFTLEILQLLNHKYNLDVRLTLLGQDNHEGKPYKEKMDEYIDLHKMNNIVDFLPANANVAEAMANADIMMIPSLQEGLPNVALEAQLMGLPCFLSSDIVQEADCGLCRFLERNKGADYWASEIQKHIMVNGLHKKFVDMSMYDLNNVCQEHLKIWRGKKYAE